jgi:toluene monooxygenase system ferredoxin subunit
MIELSTPPDLRFHPVCSLDDLWAGEVRMVEVAGVEVLLVHTADGVITAVQSRCPHQAVSLAEAELCGRVLTCPMHLWEMDVVSGCGVNPRHAELAHYPVRVEDGQLFVAVDGIEPKFSRP